MQEHQGAPAGGIRVPRRVEIDAAGTQREVLTQCARTLQVVTPQAVAVGSAPDVSKAANGVAAAGNEGSSSNVDVQKVGPRSPQE